MSDREAYVTMLNEWAPKVRAEIIDMDTVIKNCRIIGDGDVAHGVYSQLYATILNSNCNGKIHRELVFISAQAMGKVIHIALSEPERCHDIAAMFRRGVEELYEKGLVTKQAYVDIFKHGDEMYIHAASKFFGIDDSPVLKTEFESINEASKRKLH